MSYKWHVTFLKEACVGDPSLLKATLACSKCRTRVRFRPPGPRCALRAPSRLPPAVLVLAPPCRVSWLRAPPGCPERRRSRRAHGLLAAQSPAAGRGLCAGSPSVAHGPGCSRSRGVSGPGIEPASPALAGSSFTTEPQGSPLTLF